MQKTVPLRKLKRMRLQKGYKQKDIALRLQCTPQFYSELERGINVLSYQNALIIANFLDTDTDTLFKEVFTHLREEEKEREWEMFHPKKIY